MDTLPPLTAGTALSSWILEPVGTAIAVLLAGGYLTGLLLLRRSGRPWPRTHTWCFAVGLVLLVVATDSAVGPYSHTLFWMHMVQHLLLIMVVPALLVMGHPITLLQQSGQAGRRLTDALQRNGFLAFLTNAVTGLACYTIVLVLTHLTGYMSAMPTHMWLHSLEVALYLVSGYLFLMPLLVHEPIRWNPPYPVRLGLLFVSMIVDAGVGVTLMMAEVDPFPGLAAMRSGWGPSGLDDVHIGGAIMWAGGDGLMMLAIVALTARWITDTARQNDMGSVLESIRRTTMANLAGGPESDPEILASTNIDDDDDDRAYLAYNRMLARLAESERRDHPGG